MPKKKNKRGTALSLADFQNYESQTPSNQLPQPPPNAWDRGSVKIKSSAGGYTPPKKEHSPFNRNYDIKPTNPTETKTVHPPEVKHKKNTRNKSKAKRDNTNKEDLIIQMARNSKIDRLVQRNAREREYLSWILSLVGTIMVNISYMDGTLHSFELNYKDTIFKIKQVLGTLTCKNEMINKLYIEGISSELDSKLTIQSIIKRVGK